jgi:hypothetical protein
VLQAADILIWRADHVPVGQDQKQHLEVTRDIAVKFNLTYRQVFTLPEPYILEDVAVVPGTDGRKMSKSYGNTIEMFAPEKTLRKQVMGVVTDSKGVDEPKDPDTRRSSRSTRCSRIRGARRWPTRVPRGGTGYGDAKKALYEKISRTSASAGAPARSRRMPTRSRTCCATARRARAAVAELMTTCARRRRSGVTRGRGRRGDRGQGGDRDRRRHRRGRATALARGAAARWW